MTEKIALYKKLIEIHFSANSLAKELEQLRADVVLLASGSVLEVYEKLLSIPHDDIDHESKLSGLYSQLIKNIRLDLGHKSTLGDSGIQQLLGTKEPLGMNSQQGL